MADERDEERFGEPEGKSADQQTTAQQREQNGFAQQRQEAGGIGSQQGLNPTNEASSSGGDSGAEGGGASGEGFIGSQGSGSDDYLRKDDTSATDATGGSDFAKQGRGALEEEQEDEAGDGSTSDGSGGGSF